MNDTVKATPVAEEPTITRVETPDETFQEPETKEKALITPTGYGGFNNKDIDVLRKTAFSECKTMEELAMACKLAQKYELDPFAKEIWAMNMKGKLVIEASASGWRKIARRQDSFKRMIVQPWYENDEIEFDFLKGAITKHTQKPLDRTKETNKHPDPEGAYCLVEYKDGTTNLSVVYWHEYENSGTNSGSPWKKQKSEMIKNKASAIFGRTYCGVSGLYSEGEVNLIEVNPIDAGKDAKAQLRDKKATSSIILP